MKCRKCRAENPDTSVYCESCGRPLIRKPKRTWKRAPWYVLVAFLGISLVGGYLIITMNLKSVRKVKPADESVSREKVIPTVSAGDQEEPWVIGEIVVLDSGGKELSRCASLVMNDDWVVLPVWSLLGGKGLLLQGDLGDKTSLKRGYWTEGDPILLLKIDAETGSKSHELNPWKQFDPLEWRSLIDKDGYFRVSISSSEKRGPFSSFPLPYEIQEPGVFIQQGRVVGWSFPGQMDLGYLWTGPAGKDLSPNVAMDLFFRTILSQWRETHFHSVLNMEENFTAVRRLEAYAGGFLMESPFFEDDVPHELKLHSIAGRMHSLASELTANGFARDVMRILNEDILIESRNLSLIKDSVLARLEHEDYNRAIQFLGKIKKNISRMKGLGVPGLDPFLAKLYKDWLRNILDQGGYYSGMVAFEEAKRIFPDDLELHLLGVEVALSENNWARARELLQMRDYPDSLKGWAGELENKIQEVQENEGAVTVRFNPGTSHIPVNVYLNGIHSFRFVLDTGATMCSIPKSAVERLKIKIDQSTPVRLISTAGGLAETYEVKIDSIELEGFRVYNVSALIIDIPGYRDYGLLGQNFLNNFHIEIDNKKGILRLKRR